MAPASQLLFRLWVAVVLAWVAVDDHAVGQVEFTNATTAAGITYSLPPSPPSLSAYATCPDRWRRGRRFRQRRLARSVRLASLGHAGPVPQQPRRHVCRRHHVGISRRVAGAEIDGVAVGATSTTTATPTSMSPRSSESNSTSTTAPGTLPSKRSHAVRSWAATRCLGTSESMGDYDNDGYLDMYVGEWRVLRLLRRRTRVAAQPRGRPAGLF